MRRSIVTSVVVLALAPRAVGDVSPADTPTVVVKEGTPVEELKPVGLGLMQLLSAEPAVCPRKVVKNNEGSVLFCGATLDASLEGSTAAVDKYMLEDRQARVTESAWTKKRGVLARTYAIGSIPVTVQLVIKKHSVVMEYPLQCFDAVIPAPRRVGEELKYPVLLTRIAPEYPEVQRQARVEADLFFHILVRADGTLGQICLLQDSGTGLGFDDAATKAISKWRYEPARLDGEPIALPFAISVRFRLR
jgi:TonB family protein